MRKWGVLLLLFGFAWPAMAAKNLSIGQAEQLLNKLRTKTDSKAAAALSNVQLTERVSPARLAHWDAEFPGSRTREQLMRLADLSAFLNPPASDALPDPRPDIKTQEQMLRMAVRYVENAMSRLPDFYATRQTTHFEDTLSEHTGYSVENTSTGQDEHEALSAIALSSPSTVVTTVFKALHSTGQFSRTVTYHNGREVAYAGAGQQKTEPSLGLTTSGEFGPILAQVLSDALQNNIGWLRWAKGPNGPAGVFDFDVPAAKSHFRVNITSGGPTQAVDPAYHGEIEIDPATGEILRLSEIADMSPPNQMIRAAIAVEYAPVTIGGRTFICPAHGVAFSKIPVPTKGVADKSAWPVQTELNDVVFTHYHEFRAEVRILTAANGGAGSESAATEPAAKTSAGLASESQASAGSAPAAARGPATSPIAASAGAPGPASEQAANSSSNAGSAQAKTAPESSSANTAAASSPQVESATAGAEAPGTEAETATPTASGNAASNMPIPVFHAQSNLVLVDVAVARHGKPVTGLDRSQFRVFEDGKPMAIASFEEHQPAPAASNAPQQALPANTWSNVPAYPGTDAVNVLLLDALNTPASDQERVRRAMIGYLGAIRPGTPMAVFTLSSRLRMAAGFTSDTASLLKILKSSKGKPGSAAGVGSGRGSSMSSDLERAASSVDHASDPETMWLVGQIQQFATDTNVHDADQRATITIAALSELARYLTAIPGRKNLIWFSGSFPIGIGMNDGARTPLKDMRDYSGALKQMDALLAAARVAVYPVDARGVTTQPTADATNIPPPAFPQAGQGGGADASINGENKTFEEQTPLEQGTMKQIAAATGGQVFSAGNDLKAAIEKIVANDGYYYTLSYVPPQADQTRRAGAFHAVDVKVSGGRYQLSYRRGYYSRNAAPMEAGAGEIPSPMAEAAEFGAPPSTQILFQARLRQESTPSRQGAALNRLATGEKSAGFAGGTRRYIVDLRVEPKGITFAEGANGARQSRLECALVAYDAQGRTVNSLGRAFNIDLPPGHYKKLIAAGGTIPIRLALDLPAGETALRAVVYDPASARTGSLEIPVPAGSADGEAPAGASADSSSR